MGQQSKEEKKGTWNKLLNGDIRIVYWFYLVIMIIAVVAPISIPLNLTAQPKILYDHINNLPAGSAVLINAFIEPSSLPEQGPFMEVVFTQLAKLPLKLVLFTTDPNSIGILPNYLQYFEAPGKTYGTDYVYLGYFPGDETALASVAADIRSIATVDYKGTPINQLPVLTGINSAKDFALVITYGGTSRIDTATIRQFKGTYDTPVALIIIVVDQAQFMVYYPDTVVAVVAGPKDMASYEVLAGRPGRGAKYMNLSSLGHLTVIGLIVLGNIVYFNAKREGGKK